MLILQRLRTCQDGDNPVGRIGERTGSCHALAALGGVFFIYPGLRSRGCGGSFRWCSEIDFAAQNKEAGGWVGSSEGLLPERIVLTRRREAAKNCKGINFRNTAEGSALNRNLCLFGVVNCCSSACSEFWYTLFQSRFGGRHDCGAHSGRCQVCVLDRYLGRRFACPRLICPHAVGVPGGTDGPERISRFGRTLIRRGANLVQTGADKRCGISVVKRMLLACLAVPTCQNAHPDLA